MMYPKVAGGYYKWLKMMALKIFLKLWLFVDGAYGVMNPNHLESSETKFDAFELVNARLTDIHFPA